MSETLPPLGKTIACSAAHGDGGLGQHFAQIVENARAAGALNGYYAPGIKTGDDDRGRIVAERLSSWLFHYTPVRFDSGWKSHLGGDLFDRAVAGRLRAPLGEYIGFGGQALRSFGRARRLGAARLGLVAANSHVSNVARLHARAHRQYPLEGSWLNGAQVRKTLREYEMADVIYVASEYTRQTFLAEGFPEEKLHRVHYETRPRFQPPFARPQDGVFRVVYTGSLSVMKGIPVLLDAFSRLEGAAELTLVGGWSSRGMRRYLQERLARDPRIQIAPGDPLPHLQRADVYVHPTYEDGWSYAPVEALACGIPVIVTEDTGMKEQVREGINGHVVPIGTWEAILERLEHLRSAPLAAGVSGKV